MKHIKRKAKQIKLVDSFPLSQTSLSLFVFSNNETADVYDADEVPEWNLYTKRLNEGGGRRINGTEEIKHLVGAWERYIEAKKKERKKGER
ncbi:hypothetical protein TNCV_2137601 [Trichonephila clavipes]|nr:hypothetical protein TNCV_2137601 [Trichonephila clavipes]